MAGAWANPPHRGCGADRLFDRLLHVRFMQMVSPVSPRHNLVGQLFGREEPVWEENDTFGKRPDNSVATFDTAHADCQGLT